MLEELALSGGERQRVALGREIVGVLLRRAILASTTEGELVFDPFCGSGTTGVAAKELGRFFVGAETGEEYAGLAGRRIGAAARGEVLREIPGLRSSVNRAHGCRDGRPSQR